MGFFSTALAGNVTALAKINPFKGGTPTAQETLKALDAGVTDYDPGPIPDKPRKRISGWLIVGIAALAVIVWKR